MASAPVLQPRRLAAEFPGSAFLAAVVIGPGIAAQRLSSGGTGLKLLENSAADGHEAHCPGSRRIHIRFTGDRSTGQQLAGHPYAEIAKRIDVAATAIFHRMTAGAVSDLVLSCTAPAVRGTRSRSAPSLGPARQAVLSPSQPQRKTNASQRR